MNREISGLVYRFPIDARTHARTHARFFATANALPCAAARVATLTPHTNAHRQRKLPGGPPAPECNGLVAGTLGQCGKGKNLPSTWNRHQAQN